MTTYYSPADVKFVAEQVAKREEKERTETAQQKTDRLWGLVVLAAKDNA